MFHPIRSKCLPSDRWSTVRIPEGLRLVFSEALWLAERLNELDGHGYTHDTTRALDGLERILGDFLPGAQAAYLASLGLDDLSEYRRACYDALCRDDFRCVECSSSRINSGGLEPHHIIPRSHKGYANLICGNLHSMSNIVTLCHECHAEITDPARSSDHWRNRAPKYFSRTGSPELADKMREIPEQ